MVNPHKIKKGTKLICLNDGTLKNLAEKETAEKAKKEAARVEEEKKKRARDEKELDAALKSSGSKKGKTSE